MIFVVIVVPRYQAVASPAYNIAVTGKYRHCAASRQLKRARQHVASARSKERRPPRDMEEPRRCNRVATRFTMFIQRCRSTHVPRARSREGGERQRREEGENCC